MSLPITHCEENRNRESTGEMFVTRSHSGTLHNMADNCEDGLCIKVGRGQGDGDGDVGTRVWGLGTWGRETRDLRTSSMGRGNDNDY